jgi:hypothetical protein
VRCGRRRHGKKHRAVGKDAKSIYDTQFLCVSESTAGFDL